MSCSIEPVHRRGRGADALQGEKQYNQRLEDIRLLRLKIADLRREMHVLRSGTSDVDEIRRQVITLQKELLREKTRVKALSGALTRHGRV